MLVHSTDPKSKEVKRQQGAVEILGGNRQEVGVPDEVICWIKIPDGGCWESSAVGFLGAAPEASTGMDPSSYAS